MTPSHTTLPLVMNVRICRGSTLGMQQLRRHAAGTWWLSEAITSSCGCRKLSRSQLKCLHGAHSMMRMHQSTCSGSSTMMLPQEVHAVLTGLPTPQMFLDRRGYDAYVQVAWQPWPEASLLYAWASMQGPVFLNDCQCHCVLARLSLSVDPTDVTIQPRSALGTMDEICSDEELAQVPGVGQTRPALLAGLDSNDVQWSSNGCALSIRGLKAVGIVFFSVCQWPFSPQAARNTLCCWLCDSDVLKH